MCQNINPTSLSHTSPPRFEAKKPLQAPTSVIQKPQTSKRWLSQPTKSTVKQASELENRLGTSLVAAAGGLTTLTKNIMARQNPTLMKDEQFSSYITRLRVISEELKTQLKTMGNCSKLDDWNDHMSFDASYRGILKLWKEYQLVSGCVVQHARLLRERRKRESGNDSPGESAVSNSSVDSDETMVDGSSK